MTVAKRERAVEVVEVKRGSLLDEILWRSLQEVDISERVDNCLRNAHIMFVGELVQKTEEALLKLNNFGPKSLRQVKKFLAGLTLPEVQLQLGMQLNGWPGTPAIKGWPVLPLPPVTVRMQTAEPLAQDDAETNPLKGAPHDECQSAIQVVEKVEVKRLTLEQLTDLVSEMNGWGNDSIPITFRRERPFTTHIASVSLRESSMLLSGRGDDYRAALVDLLKTIAGHLHSSLQCTRQRWESARALLDAYAIENVKR